MKFSGKVVKESRGADASDRRYRLLYKLAGELHQHVTALHTAALARWRRMQALLLSKPPNPVTLHLCYGLCASLKITGRIECKLFSLRHTYKVLTTTQPSYLHILITVQPRCSTRSSSLVTLTRPSALSSLRITDRSFQHASPRLWNQLQALPVNHALISPILTHPVLSVALSPSYSANPSHHRLPFLFFFRTDHGFPGLYCLPRLLSISVFFTF